MKGRYAIRDNQGRRELVWIEYVRSGWWRGIRMVDGGRTRGPVHTLLGRYETEKEAREVLK